MRIVYTLLIALIMITMNVIDNPPWVQRLGVVSSSSLSDLLYQKDLRIDGIETLSRVEVEQLLPVDRSHLWWLTNSELIAAKLRENARIERADVAPCGSFFVQEWGCFQIDITERRPQYILYTEGESWYVAKDGSFLSPTSASRNTNQRNLIEISGKLPIRTAPEVVRAQVVGIDKAVQTISEILGQKIRKVEVIKGGEIKVNFREIGFPVTFDAPTWQPEKIREDSERLLKLLTQYKERLGDITQVDLAFDRVAVVKWKNQQ